MITVQSPHPTVQELAGKAEPKKLYRVLVTGSRKAKDGGLVSDMIRNLSGVHYPDIVVLLGAAKGVDWLAEEWAVEEGIKVELFPANWKKFGKGAGGIRNQQMVDSGADICIAFPLEGSIGTYDCIRRAKAAGINVVEIPASAHGWT